MAVTRKPLISCLVLALLAALTGKCFIGAIRSPQPPQPRQLNSRLSMQGTQVEVAETKEEDPFLAFLDRWSTNGGLLLGSFIGIALGLGLEKLLEYFMDWTKAGMAVTGIYSAGLIIWLSQYLWRVENKQTTYAKQLSQYEQEIMIRRLSELSEDEIDALCAEVGIENDDVEAALKGDDKIKALSKKERILELFRTTEMKTSMDPRAGLPMFK
mmetsp:Transcript_110872/g.155611  ORF Transcript_110872/g.155611 Transcript_110872/m.155611 type:complete len:213 (-) Transcript_110872:180-818(-)